MKLTVKVPASTANLGPGFDALGLALQIYNTFIIQETGNPSRYKISGPWQTTPWQAVPNFVTKILQKTETLFGYSLQADIECVSEIPSSRGLGSSATVIIGLLLALNKQSGKNFPTQELLKIALPFEKHPDNLVPALLGGFTVAALEGEKVLFLQRSVTDALTVILAIPDFKLSTEQARQALPSQVSLSDATYNVGHSALVTAAFLTGTWNLLKSALQDKLHQPARAALIPGMTQALDAALAQGALGAALSGAGPTLVAFSPEEKSAKKIGDAMKQAFEKHQVPCTIILTNIDNKGAALSTP